MKKKISVFFLFLTLLSTLGVYGISSVKKTLASEVMPHKCKAEILLDASSGTVINSYNDKERLPIASMCKIMTLLLCFEAEKQGELSFDEKIVISESSAGMGGSQVYLEANAEYKVCDLIKSIIIASANDSCVALAERLCGTESAFVDKMNEKAKELSMNDTIFVNCTGLPQSGQYSCANDVSVMFRELIKFDKYFDYSQIWMDEVSHPKGRKTEISNTNKLIRFYDGCDSGKTGYTGEAGHCLAASAKRNGMRVICVVICAPDSKTRFSQVSALFNYAFSNYESKCLIDDKTPLDISVSVDGGKKNNVSVIAEKPFYIFSKKNEKRSFEMNFIPSNAKTKAPINKGIILGTLSIYENGIEIGKVNVIASEDVEKKSFFDEINGIIDNWSII